MSLDVYLSDDYCEHCGRGDEIWEANITHNLAKMASEAGIYEHLWRPEEINIQYAGQLIEPLGAAIAAMGTDPSRFRKHNPENGWGTYDGFLSWVKNYYEACKKHPDARIRVSR